MNFRAEREEAMEEKKKTGGWNFPVRLNPKTGAIEMTENLEADIRQSILILLNTRKGERMFHQHYGTNLHQFLFEPIRYTLIKNIKEEVQKSIRQWEDRVHHVSVDIFHSEKEDTKLMIHIAYTIRETEEREEWNYLYSLLEEK